MKKIYEKTKQMSSSISSDCAVFFWSYQEWADG